MLRPVFESKSGIYMILNTANSNFYVGSSRNLPSRFSAHRRALETKRHEGPGMQAAWDKYGPETFRFEVIEYCEPDRLIEREQAHIDVLRPRYNRNPIAGKPPVTEGTPERRAAVSAQFKGRKHTEQTKQRMSEAAKGRKISEETREKMRAAARVRAEAKKGTKDSEEVRKRKADALEKRRQADPSMSWLDEARRKRALLTPEQVVEVRRLRRSGISQAEVAKIFNVGYWVIADIMRGRSFAYVPDHI